MMFIFLSAVVRVLSCPLLPTRRYLFSPPPASCLYTYLVYRYFCVAVVFFFLFLCACTLHAVNIIYPQK